RRAGHEPGVRDARRAGVRREALGECGEIDDLERWGLVVEVADDLRWRYYLAPSALGHYYLRNPEAERYRHAIRAEEVDRRETPDNVALE
ncbi:MAG: hypothetical protein ABL908_21140, partial [Hyphomicrobium sp.]